MVDSKCYGNFMVPEQDEYIWIKNWIDNDRYEDVQLKLINCGSLFCMDCMKTDCNSLCKRCKKWRCNEQCQVEPDSGLSFMQ